MTSELLVVLSVWLLASAAVGWIAQTKGRDAIHWFLGSLIVSPVIGGIAAMLLKPGEPTTTLRPGVTPCANCGKPLSPYWKERCGHCGAPL